MDEPVDHRGGYDVVGEGLAPPPEGQVRGDHDRALLVAGGDELEEEVRGVLVEGDVAHLVDLSRCRDEWARSVPVPYPPDGGETASCRTRSTRCGSWIGSRPLAAETVSSSPPGRAALLERLQRFSQAGFPAHGQHSAAQARGPLYTRMGTVQLQAPEVAVNRSSRPTILLPGAADPFRLCPARFATGKDRTVSGQASSREMPFSTSAMCGFIRIAIKGSSSLIAPFGFASPTILTRVAVPDSASSNAIVACSIPFGMEW